MKRRFKALVWIAAVACSVTYSHLTEEDQYCWGIRMPSGMCSLKAAINIAHTQGSVIFPEAVLKAVYAIAGVTNALNKLNGAYVYKYASWSDWWNDVRTTDFSDEERARKFIEAFKKFLDKCNDLDGALCTGLNAGEGDARNTRMHMHATYDAASSNDAALWLNKNNNPKVIHQDDVLKEVFRYESESSCHNGALHVMHEFLWRLKGFRSQLLTLGTNPSLEMLRTASIRLSTAFSSPSPSDPNSQRYNIDKLISKGDDVCNAMIPVLQMLDLTSQKNQLLFHLQDVNTSAVARTVATCMTLSLRVTEMAGYAAVLPVNWVLVKAGKWFGDRELEDLGRKGLDSYHGSAGVRGWVAGQVQELGKRTGLYSFLTGQSPGLTIALAGCGLLSKGNVSIALRAIGVPVAFLASGGNPLVLLAHPLVQNWAPFIAIRKTWLEGDYAQAPEGAVWIFSMPLNMSQWLSQVRENCDEIEQNSWFIVNWPARIGKIFISKDGNITIPFTPKMFKWLLWDTPDLDLDEIKHIDTVAPYKIDAHETQIMLSGGLLILSVMYFMLITRYLDATATYFGDLR